MPLFAAAIFLSAFLLFQVQPVIARYILPWYGGSPSVWTACLLFFQAGLLGGYAYAHALATFLRERRGWQAGIHLGLLGVALLLMPITPDESLKPDGGEASPTLDIIRLLGLTVGFPYLLLSASGPLLQHWFGETYPGRSPYRLYAVSNAGSMLGLLSYPFLVEPVFAVTRQTQLWSVGFGFYALFAVACGVALLKRGRSGSAGSEGETGEGGEVAVEVPAPRPSFGEVLLWIALAATGSSLLLAITNQMCQDVSVVPFLWVAPLSLYLLTFVIAFDHERWYRRRIAVPLAALAVASAIWLLGEQSADHEPHLVWQLAIFLGAIFSTCFVCHGELVRIKPAPRHLTAFYLAIAFGGALGGLFVSLLAPTIFNGYWEFHLSLFVFVALVSAMLLKEAARVPRISFQILSTLVAGAALVLAATALRKNVESVKVSTLDASRSFYGTLRVYEYHVDDADHNRVLYHGRITHGLQYLEDRFLDLRTTYYGTFSGVGQAFARQVSRYEEIREPLEIGVVGLGVGTVAAFAEAGDTVRFYEIDPDVEEIARRHFTYLEDCEGEVEVVLGDARVSMERELREDGSRQYDLLIVDAFSGDSIPLHLLTREAFALYLRHLKPDGILLVHISNLYLDLSDPVRRAAAHFDYDAWRVDHAPASDYEYYSDWILVSRDGGLGDFLRERDALTEWDLPEPRAVDWTDDYANLLHVVMWDDWAAPFQRILRLFRRGSD